MAGRWGGEGKREEEGWKGGGYERHSENNGGHLESKLPNLGDKNPNRWKKRNR